MNTGRVVLEISFRSLLGRIVGALGFPPAIYRISDEGLKSVCVFVRAAGPNLVYAFLGRPLDDIDSSLEDAAEQGVRELISIYNLCVVDVNWSERTKYEKQKSLFELQRKWLCRFEKRQAINMQSIAGLIKPANNGGVINVNFVELLGVVVTHFKLKVSSLECMEVTDGLYVAYIGLFNEGPLFGVGWVVGDECSSPEDARQDVARKAIDMLRASLCFDVRDVNYAALPMLRIQCHLVIESCLAARERCCCFGDNLGVLDRVQEGPILSMLKLNEMALG